MGEHQPDIPSTRDCHHPPNLNATVPGHGDGCEGGHNIGEGDNENAESTGAVSTVGPNGSTVGLGISDDAFVDEVRSVDGDEGAEDHLIEVGDLGRVTIRQIERSVAKYKRCINHEDFNAPPPEDCPFSLTVSPTDSGIGTPHGSMVVEVGSMSSSIAFSYCSGSSSSSASLFDCITDAFDSDLALRPLPPLFIRPPIWLSPTLEVPTPYPLELSDFEDY